MRPIFILWTRSFWFGIAPALLVLIDISVTLIGAIAADPSIAPPIASLIGWMLGGDPVVIEGWMLRLSPVMALLIAHQRSGRSRPYTIDPRARE